MEYTAIRQNSTAPSPQRNRGFMIATTTAAIIIGTLLLLAAVGTAEMRTGGRIISSARSMLPAAKSIPSPRMIMHNSPIGPMKCRSRRGLQAFQSSVTSAIKDAVGLKKKEKREVDTTELAVITGGGSGIGQALTLRLAHRGMRVLIIGRKEEPLKETQEIAVKEKVKGAVEYVSADVTKEEGRNTVAEKVKELGTDKKSTLRVLVHNAGVNTPCKPMMDITEHDWNKVMGVNVAGPLFLTQTLRPLFGTEETERNRIVMLSSVARECKGLPNYGPYAISKLAAYGLNLMLQEEMPNEKVPAYATALIPGEVDTAMQRETAFNNADAFPDHLVEYWQKIQNEGQLLPPEVTGAFMEYVICDTDKDEFSVDEWFIYDKKHHKQWADEFPDVEIVEPEGLN